MRSSVSVIGVLTTRLLVQQYRADLKPELVICILIDSFFANFNLNDNYMNPNIDDKKELQVLYLNLKIW